MSKPKIRIIALALIMALLTLSGCFDYEIFLQLKEEGKGKLAIRLKLPKKWGGKDQLQRLKSIVLPPPTREASEEFGRIVLQESVEFDWLSELAADRILFKIVTVDKGIAAMTDYTYRMTASLQPLDGDLPDRLKMPGRETEIHMPDELQETDAAQLRAQTLMARGFKGHFITMRLDLPGDIVVARPIVVGVKIIKAKVDEEKNRVTWRVPLSALVLGKVRHTLVFSVDFSGDMEFRAERHEVIQSRYPSLKDRALGQTEAK